MSAASFALHDRDRRPQIAFARIAARARASACRARSARSALPRARGAHADGEQLVDVAEVALARHADASSPLSIDVARAHRRQIAQERQLAAGFDDRRDLVDRGPRLAIAPELQQLVLQPRQRVVVAQRRVEMLARDPCARTRRRPRDPRAPRRATVPSCRKMCAGMCRAWLESGASRASVRAASSARCACCGVVVVVEQVVECAGMLGVRSQHARRGSRSTCACVSLPASVRAVAFVRVARVRSGCATSCRAAPARRTTRRPESSGRARRAAPSRRRSGDGASSASPSANSASTAARKPRSLRRRGLGAARRAASAPRRAAPARPACTSLVAPQRLVIGHRLAPVRHDEAGIEFDAPAGTPRSRLRIRTGEAPSTPRR